MKINFGQNMKCGDLIQEWLNPAKTFLKLYNHKYKKQQETNAHPLLARISSLRKNNY